MHPSVSNAVVKFAALNVAASGDLITAVAGKRIRVVGLSMAVATTVTVKFQSGASTDLTGAITVLAGSAHVWPADLTGLIQTAVGEKLNVVLGASIQVSGYIKYQEV